MKIKINGKEQTINNHPNLHALITHLTPNANRVIAELNGNIIKSAAWQETTVKDGDVLELVTFVGGG